MPESHLGDALITFHGSWNRQPETGYKVVHLPFEDGMPTGDVVPFLEYRGAGDKGTGWPHRPVGIAMSPRGRLFITGDASGAIISVGATREANLSP